MRQHQSNAKTMSIGELAETFGIARSTAYHLARNNRLPVPVIHLGSRMVVSRQAVSRLLEVDAPAPSEPSNPKEAAGLDGVVPKSGGTPSAEGFPVDGSRPASPFSDRGSNGSAVAE